MKTILLTILSLIISTSALAYNDLLLCGGKSEMGEDLQYIVDLRTKEITMGKQVILGSMPPYPYERVETWVLEKFEVKYNTITVLGYTNRITTGTAGRITITVNRLAPFVYQGTVVTKAPSSLVRPVPLVTTQVSCRLR